MSNKLLIPIFESLFAATAALAVLCSFMLATASASTVTIVPAYNGNAICADEWTTLDRILIAEGFDNLNKNAIHKNQSNVSLVLTAPSGFIFNPGVGQVNMTGYDLSAAAILVDSTTITVTFSTLPLMNAGDKLKIKGIQVRALSASPLAPDGDILRLSSNPGNAGIDGIFLGSTSFAALSQADSVIYNSSTTTQNIFAVTAGARNKDIIGIQVLTTNYCASLELSQFSLNVTGSTNASHDISEAKIWYTGTSPNFDTTDLFGTELSPGGAYTISGLTSLAPGTNYFWLSYDISVDAINGNVVDAICNSITVNGDVKTPTIIAPSGSRNIGIAICISNGTGGGLWNNPLSWLGGVVPNLNAHVTIQSGDRITMNSNVDCINLELQGTATLSMGANTLHIFGTVSADAGTNVKSTANSKLYIGDMERAVQFEFPPGLDTLQKLTLNRSNGAWSSRDIWLDVSVPADSIVLVLTDGILMMADDPNGSGNPKTVWMNSFAIERDISCDDKNHVDGFISRWVWNDNNWTTFPCGDGGHGRKMALKANSLSAGNNQNRSKLNWWTHFDYMNYNKAQLPGGISNQFFWTHERVASQNVARRFYYKDQDFTTFDVTEITIANHTTTWRETTTPIGYNSSIHYIEQATENSSNDTAWTWGALALGALPIELTMFTAEVIDPEKVILNFVTAWEENNSHFEIERSDDGREFELIGSVQGAGTTYDSKSYSFVDNDPHEGISYYRLKQLDEEGPFSYSSIVSVKIESYTIIIAGVHPNPVSNELILSVYSEKPGQLKIVLLDILGREYVIQKHSITGKEELRLQLSAYPPGIYLLNIYEQGNLLYSTKLLKDGS